MICRIAETITLGRDVGDYSARYKVDNFAETLYTQHFSLHRNMVILALRESFITRDSSGKWKTVLFCPTYTLIVD